MNEPSVLDYVKSKLAFWKPSSITIPAPEEVEPEWVNESAGLTAEGRAQALLSENAVPGEGVLIYEASDPSTVGTVERVSISGQTLALSLGSLGLALLAQGFLEPPNRSVGPAAVLYIIAACLWMYAYLRNRVLPSDAVSPEVEMNAQSAGRIRLEGLAVGLALMALTFLTFFIPKGKDVPYFNFLNTAFWLLSIGYLIWAFYVPQAGTSNLRERISLFLSRPDWKPTITRWGLLLLVVTAMVLFFRFYRLESLPSEMVSDHAEKLLDVSDVLNGQYRVFFPRNTGREAFQFYWTALMTMVFNTGISFMALKLGTVLIGLLTVYYMYRLGLELGNRWVALLTVVFVGFSYWANIQSRIGLRFPLYPGFYAPLLFYLIRALRSGRRNDFIWAGIWLGIGLHGYTSYRIVPFVVIAAFIVYLLHQRSADNRRYALVGFVILVVVSMAVFMPLLRFSFDNWDMVALRSLTRLADSERPLPGSPLGIFLTNTWSALVMFFWDDGSVWVHSITGRPALALIDAALFFLGLVLIVARYIRKRTWTDLLMLISIPLLLMPSILSLAFPNENPNLNRTAAAYVPVYLILAIGAEALLSAVKRSLPARMGTIAAGSLGLLLVLSSGMANYNLVFKQYDQAFRLSAWNTSEMGGVIRDFVALGNSPDSAWTVAYPYWVDTRLVGINAGQPTRDTAITAEQIITTNGDPRAKLFIVNKQDQEGMRQLRLVYPQGRFTEYQSRNPDKNFLVFYAPSDADTLPVDLPNSP